ncbi:sorting nexin-16-like isoform X1 [Lineus longissimus]|uniref:sorting nexin-16-like isoform X1 n=1 Tax=Lineus longissimus TaxID=88925 RepID=UPI00315D6026
MKYRCLKTSMDFSDSRIISEADLPSSLTKRTEIMDVNPNKETHGSLTGDSGLSKSLTNTHRPRATSTPTHDKYPSTELAGSTITSDSGDDEGVGLGTNDEAGVCESPLSLVSTDIQVPIVGFEIMENRTRFTVYKVNIRKGPHESWFVFRRYTDFVRLNQKLGCVFPTFRLSLPPKKWFGNFNPDFLEDRQLGLQAFLNNIVGHRDVSNSAPVRDFLCLDDPPGPHDSLEESRALCESLEENVYDLRKDIQERDARIELLEGEVAMLRAEVEALRNTVKLEKAVNVMRRSPSSSLPESGEFENDSTLCVEADQAHRRGNVNPVSPALSDSFDVLNDDNSKKLRRVIDEGDNGALKVRSEVTGPKPEKKVSNARSDLQVILPS